MKPNTTTLAAALIAATALIAHAEGPEGRPGPPRGGHRPPPGAFIGLLDTDRDGKLSAEEITKASDTLKALDTNGDGALSRDELRPKPPEKKDGGGARDAERPEPPRGGHRPPHSPLIGALDANHDGTISAEEIAAAPTVLKALDKNGDGEITPDELRPPGPPPGEEGGAPPPPPAEDGGGENENANGY